MVKRVEVFHCSRRDSNLGLGEAEQILDKAIVKQLHPLGLEMS